MSKLSMLQNPIRKFFYRKKFTGSIFYIFFIKSRFFIVLKNLFVEHYGSTVLMFCQSYADIKKNAFILKLQEIKNLAAKLKIDPTSFSHKHVKVQKSNTIIHIIIYNILCMVTGKY